MLNPTTLAPAVTLACLLGSALCQTPPPRLAVRGLDPIELCQGKETPGREDLAASRGSYTYRFASEQSRASFERDPQRYEIQWGGACARMGPLSGRGDPSRYAVHGERIYVFASDACRKAFLAAPERFLRPADPAPEFTDAQRQAGQDLLTKVLDALGGASEVDALRNLRWASHHRQESGGQTYHVRTQWHIAFPDAAHSYVAWDDGWWSNAARGERAVMRDRREEREMVDAQREAFRQTWQRSLVPLLRLRREPGFAAGSLGRGKLADGEVERLVIAYRGCTVTFGVADDGSVVASAFRDRTGGPVVEVVERYSDFRDVGGIRLPFTVAVQVDGKPSADRSMAWNAIERDVAIADDMFPNGPR